MAFHKQPLTKFIKMFNMMETQLSSLVFALTTFSLTTAEVKRYKSLITPFTVTVIPLAVISISVNFIFIYSGVSPVSFRANMLLVLLSVLIWIVGRVMSTVFSVPEERTNYFDLFSLFEPYIRVLILVAVLISVIVFGKVLSLVRANGGWFYLGTDEFERLMATGPVAHLIIFGEAVFVMIFLTATKSKYKRMAYFSLFLLGGSIFIMMVKYNLLWIIMITFLLRNIHVPVNIQIKKILKIVLILSLVFIFYFMFLTFFWHTFSIGKSRMWEYFYKTFLNYFLTGPIILDKWMASPNVKPEWTMLIVLFNIFNVIRGNPFRYFSLKYVTTGFTHVIPGISSNVGTSYGVYYLIGGFTFTLFMTLLVAVIGYAFFIKALKTDNMNLIFLNIFFLTISSLSFFGQYFTLLPFYEFPIFFVVLVVLFKGLYYLKRISTKRLI